MLLSLKLVALFVSLASASCTRFSLQATFDEFFQSVFNRAFGASSSSPALSQGIIITQNNQLLKFLEESAWENTTSFYKKLGY
jgi:hypothetical protein